VEAKKAAVPPASAVAARIAVMPLLTGAVVALLLLVTVLILAL
jgi:hypothetical protein